MQYRFFFSMIISILIHINTFAYDSFTHNIDEVNLAKYKSYYNKMVKKLKKHCKAILSLSHVQIKQLQNLYHKLHILHQDMEKLLESLDTEVAEYLHVEKKLRSELIKELDLEKFSIHYANDQKFNVVNGYKELHDKIKSSGVEDNLLNKNNKKYKKRKYDLLRKYEKYVNSIPKEVRNKAQKIRTVKYEKYIEQRSFFYQLSHDLREFLYKHFYMKKLPMSLKLKVVKQILALHDIK
ncbi:MAG: hypothetical protein AAFO15_01175 [Pseudomonadota bacterium]